MELVVASLLGPGITLFLVACGLDIGRHAPASETMGGLDLPTSSELQRFLGMVGLTLVGAGALAMMQIS